MAAPAYWVDFTATNKVTKSYFDCLASAIDYQNTDGTVYMEVNGYITCDHRQQPPVLMFGLLLRTTGMSAMDCIVAGPNYQVWFHVGAFSKDIGPIETDTGAYFGYSPPMRLQATTLHTLAGRAAADFQKGPICSLRVTEQTGVDANINTFGYRKSCTWAMLWNSYVPPLP
jgi:hypothetical protein